MEEAMTRVEILYFDGCPTWQRAAEMVRTVLCERGQDADVRVVRVESVEDARRLRFLGSPTIRIDGRDVEPTVAQGVEPSRDARSLRACGQFGLQCRLYHDGERFLGVPPADWIRAALDAGTRVERP
jgi:hypothetical protein